MGISASKPVPKDAESSRPPSADEFDANDLLRHLQEHEGYEVYDVFERPKDGGRLPAPVRLWVEADEVASGSPAAAKAAAAGGTADSGGTVAAPAVESETAGIAVAKQSAPAAVSSSSGAKLQVDVEPWVVLTSASGPSPPPPPPRTGKAAAPKKPPPGKGKGPPPAPPPKSKGGPGKPPPPTKAKAGGPLAKKGSASATSIRQTVALEVAACRGAG